MFSQVVAPHEPLGAFRTHKLLLPCCRSTEQTDTLRKEYNKPQMKNGKSGQSPLPVGKLLDKPGLVGNWVMVYLLIEPSACFVRIKGKIQSQSLFCHLVCVVSNSVTLIPTDRTRSETPGLWGRFTVDNPFDTKLFHYQV